MQKSIHEPDTYRQLSIPFETVDKADEMINSFYALVREARKQFRIPDVHIITIANAVIDGKEQGLISSAHFGNTDYGEKMCAWGLAQEKRDRAEAINKILSEANDPAQPAPAGPEGE